MIVKFTIYAYFTFDESIKLRYQSKKIVVALHAHVPRRLLARIHGNGVSGVFLAFHSAYGQDKAILLKDRRPRCLK